jgi:hypothetical protein
LISDDGGVTQRVADGHIAVIGHDHEGAGLHGQETVHDESFQISSIGRHSQVTLTKYGIGSSHYYLKRSLFI